MIDEEAQRKRKGQVVGKGRRCYGFRKERQQDRCSWVYNHSSGYLVLMVYGLVVGRSYYFAPNKVGTIPIMTGSFDAM